MASSLLGNSFPRMYQKCGAFCLLPLRRTIHKFTTITMDPKTNIATLTLNRPPANALNPQLMQEIKNSIQQLEAKETNCQGVILTSAPGKIFCAGLDLNELHQSDEANLRLFWRSLQDMWRALFATRLPTAVAINGHAPAGGCVIANCCDYRVMLQNYSIGLNEVCVGLAVPFWVKDNFLNITPTRRQAELALTQGRIFKSQQAFELGLLDALADDDAEALQKSKDFLLGFRQVGAMARERTKLQMRADAIRDFDAGREKELEFFLKNIQMPEVKQFFETYLKNLKKK